MQKIKKSVHIAIADRGWIIERIAKKLTSSLSYVDYSMEENDESFIQYYMTYARFRKRVSPVEIGLFTHIEEFVPEATQKFFDIANRLDICICQSNKYAHFLKQASVPNVHVIQPGIDVGLYSSNIRIGVVGRTYWTGRKGEDVVEKLISLPNIDWHFTGDGWPLPSISLSDDEMPIFYRQMDYILITSYYEGGPMCVLESLAAGTQVIAPDVGWCKEFPCIFYNAGNWEELKKILMDLSAVRDQRRNSVTDFTWENFVEKHDKLFRNIFTEHGIDIETEKRIDTIGNKVKTNSQKKLSIGLVMHGERHAGGGPSTRIPILAKKLRECGQEVFILTENDIAKFLDIDVFHVFNSWPPSRARKMLETIRTINPKGKIVWSPIYLDLSHYWLWHNWLRNFLVNSSGLSIEDMIKTFSFLSEFEIEETRWLCEPLENYLHDMRWCLNEVDYIICLSNCEKSRLFRDFNDLPAIEIIANVTSDNIGIDYESIPTALNDVKDFVLCIGRVEARKNQLALALALKDTKFKLVTVGKQSDGNYDNFIQNTLKDQYLPLGRITEKRQIGSIIKKAHAVAFTSWTEGMSLALIEAIVTGSKRIITSTRSGEHEYLADTVEYVDPWDINNIKKTITSADQIASKDDVIDRLTDWPNHVKKTLCVYQSVFEN